MKRKSLAIALAITGISMLSGCGSSGGGSNNPASNIIGYTTQCTASGCVQVPIYGTSGGCVPLSAPIYFAGSGQLMSSGYTNTLQAGVIPNGGSFGSLAISAGPVNVGGGTVINSVSAGSQLQMSISGGGGYGVATSNVSLAGQLQLSQLIQQQISYYSQGVGGYGYTGQTGYSPFVSGPGYYGSNSVCVSGIALQGYLYNGVPAMAGTAFLYLNNTTHGWALPLN